MVKRGQVSGLTVRGENQDRGCKVLEIIGKVRAVGTVEKWAKNLVMPGTVYSATDCSEKGQINIILPTELPSTFSAPSAFFEIVEDTEGRLALCMENTFGEQPAAPMENGEK